MRNEEEGDNTLKVSVSAHVLAQMQAQIRSLAVKYEEAVKQAEAAAEGARRHAAASALAAEAAERHALSVKKTTSSSQNNGDNASHLGSDPESTLRALSTALDETKAKLAEKESALDIAASNHAKSLATMEEKISLHVLSVQELQRNLKVATEISEANLLEARRHAEARRSALEALAKTQAAGIFLEIDNPIHDEEHDSDATERNAEHLRPEDVDVADVLNTLSNRVQELQKAVQSALLRETNLQTKLDTINNSSPKTIHGAESESETTTVSYSTPHEAEHGPRIAAPRTPQIEPLSQETESLLLERDRYCSVPLKDLIERWELERWVQERQLLRDRVQELEREAANTRMLLGHSNSAQKVQYLRRIRTELDAARREASIALAERFELEQMIRYLAVRGGLPEAADLRRDATGGDRRAALAILRPESLAKVVQGAEKSAQRGTPSVQLDDDQTPPPTAGTPVMMVSPSGEEVEARLLTKIAAICSPNNRGKVCT